jgi:hypothetical protein
MEIDVIQTTTQGAGFHVSSYNPADVKAIKTAVHTK